MSHNKAINCLNFSILPLFLLFFQVSGAQKRVKEIGIEKYSGLNASLTSRQKQLGEDVAVLVWTDTLVFKKEMGAFDSRTQAPLSGASSWLTAALVLQLVDEGVISLDDKITRYLPVFAKYGKNYITIRHCLAHMTGIQAESSGGLKLFDKKKFASLQEEVESYAAREIQTNPGTEMRFSSIGLNIAGRILEVVTKKKFDMLAQQKLFRLMGMRSTTFGNLDGSAINPAAGAKSSADDYMKFLSMLLNKGIFNGKQVLSENAVSELLKMQVASGLVRNAPKAVEGSGYAFGSWVLPAEGKGTGAAFSAPGYYGTWPVLDLCQGYALLILPKENGSEAKRELMLDIKKEIDGSISSPKKGACL